MYIYDDPDGQIAEAVESMGEVTLRTRKATPEERAANRRKRLEAEREEIRKRLSQINAEIGE